MNVTHLTIWTCSAEGCDHTEEQKHVESVWAALDPRTALRRPSLPEGWQDVEGRAYCGCHTVEVQAIIRTLVTNDWHVTAKGILVGVYSRPSQREEIVQLRRAA